MKESNRDKLYNYIRNLDDFLIQKREVHTYNHIGAIIIDTILQSGLNYKNVVLPRVQRFIGEFPEQRTTRDFHNILNDYDIGILINWKGYTKISRIISLKNFFLKRNIMTEEDLRAWLSNTKNETLLYRIKGIGYKTVDYLKMLVGIQTIAIDRHLKNFVINAGLILNSYNKIKTLLIETSAELNIDPISLDYSIWVYMNSKVSNQFS